MKVRLETERLLLRELVADDAALLLALDSDPEVMRYIGVAPPPTIAAYADLIRDRFRPWYEQYPGCGVWAAHERAGGRFIGWAYLRPARYYRFRVEVGFEPNDAELGYRLMRSAWGRGHATELARPLVEQALNELGASRVVACALATNRASIRVMEKCGLTFRHEATLFGFDVPTHVYARTR